MPRKPLVFFPGAIYHITNRGNRHSPLFYDDQDRMEYLKILEETHAYYPFNVHTYCLMGNHIHVLVETITHHPKDIMKRLNTLYAIYLNKRYEFEGHVFQGRYKAKLIDSQQYFIESSRYIHMNPVEANIIDSPENYPWSSLHYYLPENKIPPPPFITTDKILSLFPEPKMENYIKFLQEERKDKVILPR